MVTRSDELYETDFYAWTRAQAEALRRMASERREVPLDLEHLAEELEDIGSACRNAVRTRVRRIIEHRLKLVYASATERRTGWLDSIDEALAEIDDKLTATIRRDIGDRLKKLYAQTCPRVVRDLESYGERAAAPLRALGVTVSLVPIPAGEDSKTIDTVAALWSAFLKAGIERGHAVIALGGGVVGDLTGFAAATWLRGVRWIGLPTTLLAMVDSSLGGKTGADLPEGKNLIGAFHPPALVLADTATLATLPGRDLRCGLAEAVKHAVIGDPGLLDTLPRFAFCKDGDASIPCARLSDAAWLAPFVARAMAVKIRIIREDPFEKGFRAALNLGHTIGHGIEKATHFAVRHGEAIAIGTVLEARLAEELGLAQPGLAGKLANLFSSLGLPVVPPPDIDPAEVLAAITLDKKKTDGKVRFALPVGLGEVRTGVTVDDASLTRVLKRG